ncbi:hypothetical protein EVAR_90687_1 [Eumeta japonica]|uniref:Uncharacterized protein n=1 Tax=Eumeta variegata TaxID=151549 RepID=A0A4C1YVW6_EUMVA|nr:hypothetical protein EVAR_90687_1 [Eumeta japonica]
MVEQKAGHVVFVSSLQGRIAIPHRSAYGASKHALQAFADSLRAEVNNYNIKVSVISPGYIQTSMSLNALTASGETYGIMDNTTASGYSAEYVANKIMDMITSQSEKIDMRVTI